MIFKEITFNKYVCKIIFLISYLLYVLNNSVEFNHVISLEYKHGLFICIALISLLYKTDEAIKSAIVVLPITMIYIFGGILPYAVMSIVFALSLPIIWMGVSSIILSDGKKIIVLMIIISLIPALSSQAFLFENGLFDTTYGRPRMLLGYIHPKEAAICFFIPLFLSLLAYKTSNVLAWFSVFIFLWLVGSRNIALAFILAWFLRQYGYLMKFLILPIAIIGSLFLINIDSWFNEVDQLTSLRLSHWVNMLNNSEILNDINYSSGERFGGDNFFVEVLSISGFFGAIMLFLWILEIFFILRIKNKNYHWPWICFIMLIFVSFFDSGIVSTGNMIHVLLWSIIVSPIYNKYSFRINKAN